MALVGLRSLDAQPSASQPVAVHRVATAAELDAAIARAAPGDAIELRDGMWTDVRIDFSSTGTRARPITLRARTPGRAVLTGTSTLRITGPHLVVDGLVFRRAQPVESKDPVIVFRSRHGRLVNSSVEHYNPPAFETRYHWVQFAGDSNVVERCFFANKTHQGPVIALADSARYNAVRHSWFKDMPHVSANGREVIQAIGYGSSEELGADGAFMTIEFNLFERADGEGAEIISLKSNRNLVRFNTIRATIGGIVGRSGNFNTVEGNIILGENQPGTQGIRLSGQGHRVLNNYVAGVTGGALRLYAGEHFVDERGKVDSLTPDFKPIFRGGTPYGVVPAYGRVVDAVVAFNTFVNNTAPAVLIGDEYRSGWPARQRIILPEQVRFVNNLVVSPGAERGLFALREPDTLPPLQRFRFSPNTFGGNVAFGGALGSDRPELARGVVLIDPKLVAGRDGLLRLSAGSPSAVRQLAPIVVERTVPAGPRFEPRQVGVNDYIGSLHAIRFSVLTSADVGPTWMR